MSKKLFYPNMSILIMFTAFEHCQMDLAKELKKFNLKFCTEK